MAEILNRRGRPKHCRRVSHTTIATRFAPDCCQTTQGVRLGLDELEAIRLTDLENLYQVEAAAKMNVSRQTLGRILKMAHAKVADSLINGKVLIIQGGQVERHPGTEVNVLQDYICPRCDSRSRRLSDSPHHNTHCPSCGTKMQQEDSKYDQQRLERSTTE